MSVNMMAVSWRFGFFEEPSSIASRSLSLLRNLSSRRKGLIGARSWPRPMVTSAMMKACTTRETPQTQTPVNRKAKTMLFAVTCQPAGV
jgi:hypothetical protein